MNDSKNKYIKLDDSHGEIAVYVEAILFSCKDEVIIPVDVDNTTFFVYKLNRPDPELEMIEVM